MAVEPERRRSILGHAAPNHLFGMGSGGKRAWRDPLQLSGDLPAPVHQVVISPSFSIAMGRRRLHPAPAVLSAPL